MAEAAEKSIDGKEWLKKVEGRQKVLKKDWLKDAEKVCKLYSSEKPADVPFNILYSNTETILPALYNSTPRPEVARRFTSRDPQQRAHDILLSQVIERSLEYTADTNSAEYETFSEAVKASIMDALVPGLGQARVRYHQDGGYQQICYESVAHDRFIWGYARKWRSVPWVAYGHDLLRSDFEAQFPEFCKKKEYKDFDWAQFEKEEQELSQAPEDTDEGGGKQRSKALLVWEVWDWATRSVFYICDRFEGSVLLEEPYPERLTGRFPSPPPIVFVQKRKDTTPVPPYRIYQEQAEALNMLARREKRLTRALRVRGIYNSAHSELQTIFNQDDDNILIPSETSAAFQDGGLDRAIWMLPIDMIVGTLREVQAAMAAAKQNIYEIMGIGDILRGASDPNETARAQEIKNQWGGLRIKRSQKEVQEFCRELFRIATDFMATYWTPATYASVTQLPLLYAAQKQQMMMQAQMAQQQAMMQAQQTGQPPQQPPPPDPRLQLPSWEDVTKLLQDNLQRSFRIDIETNSTVDLEATEDKQSIAEFMNAFGQMMSGITPLVEAGVADFEFAKVMVLETARRFRFGRRMEDALEQMHAPAPQGDNGEAAKQQATLEVKKAQADAASQIEQMRKQMTQMEGDLQRKDIELTALKQNQQLEQKQNEIRFGQQGLDHKAQQFQVKTDYHGKITMAKQQNDQKQQQLAAKELQGLQQQIAAMIDSWRQEAAAGDEKRKMEQEAAAAEAKPAEDLRPMIEQLAAGQMALQEAMVGLAKEVKEVARLAGAERESELIVGPDGKKRARSRILQ